MEDDISFWIDYLVSFFGGEQFVHFRVGSETEIMPLKALDAQNGLV